MSTPTTDVLCLDCGEIGQHHSRRLCTVCYPQRWRSGTLNQFALLTESLPASRRREDFAELRSRRVSVRVAAERIGVSTRTAERYEARLKAPEAAG